MIGNELEGYFKVGYDMVEEKMPVVSVVLLKVGIASAHLVK
jgi:hypothetical protein